MAGEVTKTEDRKLSSNRDATELTRGGTIPQQIMPKLAPPPLGSNSRGEKVKD